MALQRYSIKQDFFKTWSPDMSYFLGFWFASGHIYGDKIFDIMVQKKDKYILKKLAELLEYKGTICDYVDRQVYRLNFSCKAIYDDLVSLGGNEQKKTDLIFPKIPSKYLPDFIRGFFDGKGSVFNVQGNRINVAFDCENRVFAYKLWNILIIYADVEGGSYDKNNIRLVFGKKDSLKIANFMYNTSSNLFLERKRNKFLKFINL